MTGLEKRAAANLLRMAGTRMDVLDVRYDHARDAVLVELAGGRTWISNHEFQRELRRITPNPIVEAFTAMAVAIHDHEKRKPPPTA